MRERSGASWRILYRIATRESAWYAFSPVTSSYRMRPAEKRSLRPSISPAEACSGDI
jgi:hypothetical protein